MSLDRFDQLIAPTERTRIVVSRYWNNPEITIKVDEKMISLFTDLPAFISALVAEIDQPLTLTRTSLELKLQKAAKRSVEKIKEASSQVM